MRYFLLAVAILLTICTVVTAAEEPLQEPTILSIIPGQGAPGTTVVIAGSGLSEQISAFLGTNEIPTKLLSPRQLSFEIPELAPGNYALYLQHQTGVTSKAYSFNVVPVKPVATALSQESISFCAAGEERTVIVKGKNFLEGAQLLFDGATVRSRRLSGEEISFSVPRVPGGLHQVQIKNPEETFSATLGLLVTTRPEIQSVTQGVDYVNYYDLDITGLNFQQGSTLIVDGRKLQSGYAIPGERDLLRYISCTRLVYQRYPYDPSMKSFSLIVVNPAGEESPPFIVSAP
jgi:hypothetical protein